jgi:hypothetical protein
MHILWTKRAASANSRCHAVRASGLPARRTSIRKICIGMHRSCWLASADYATPAAALSSDQGLVHAQTCAHSPERAQPAWSQSAARVAKLSGSGRPCAAPARSCTKPGAARVAKLFGGGQPCAAPAHRCTKPGAGPENVANCECGGKHHADNSQKRSWVVMHVHLMPLLPRHAQPRCRCRTGSSDLAFRNS